MPVYKNQQIKLSSFPLRCHNRLWHRLIYWYTTFVIMWIPFHFLLLVMIAEMCRFSVFISYLCILQKKKKYLQEDSSSFFSPFAEHLLFVPISPASWINRKYKISFIKFSYIIGIDWILQNNKCLRYVFFLPFFIFFFDVHKSQMFNCLW